MVCKMTNEDLFALAKQQIFGDAPKSKAERLGYEMALRYYSPIIKDAESVLLGLSMPTSCLRINLENAATFTQYCGMRVFLPETRKALELYASNFNTRYAPVLEEMTIRETSRA